MTSLPLASCLLLLGISTQTAADTTSVRISADVRSLFRSRERQVLAERISADILAAILADGLEPLRFQGILEPQEAGTYLEFAAPQEAVRSTLNSFEALASSAVFVEEVEADSIDRILVSFFRPQATVPTVPGLRVVSYDPRLRLASYEIQEGFRWRYAWDLAREAVHVEPDYRCTAVLSSHAGRRSSPPTNWGTKHVQLPASQQLSTQDEVIVAVIDSGVDWSHPDLQGRLWVNPREVPWNGHDDDGNDLDDDVHGWNFAGWSPFSFDTDGHGTQIAGIIAGLHDGKGNDGIAPNARLMPLRVYSPPGEAREFDLVRAIRYAVCNGAQVVNCSWGSRAELKHVQEEILWAGREYGTLFVASAGNQNGKPQDGEPQNAKPPNNDSYPFYPASFDAPNLVSVMAIEYENAVSGVEGVHPDSNWGKSSVDIAAPGDSVLSALPGGGWGRGWGTSMSAAFVTGAAARLWHANGGSYVRVVDAIFRGAKGQPYLAGLCATEGSLDVEKSHDLSREGPAPEVGPVPCGEGFANVVYRRRGSVEGVLEITEAGLGGVIGRIETPQGRVYVSTQDAPVLEALVARDGRRIIAEGPLAVLAEGDVQRTVLLFEGFGETR